MGLDELLNSKTGSAHSLCVRPSCLLSSKDGGSVWSRDAWSHRPTAISVSSTMRLEEDRVNCQQSRTSWCCVLRWDLPSILLPSRRRCQRSFGAISDQWLGSGEDWPQAYRHSSISFEEALACVVVFWHDEWQELAFQIYSSLLFGLPLAVTSFNRYSRFAEAALKPLVEDSLDVWCRCIMMMLIWRTWSPMASLPSGPLACWTRC